MSDVVITRNGAYVLQVVEHLGAQESSFDLEKAQLTTQLLTSKRNDMISAWLTELRDQAEITDNRHRFYTEF